MGGEEGLYSDLDSAKALASATTAALAQAKALA
jgi:hypothetical protein